MNNKETNIHLTFRVSQLNAFFSAKEKFQNSQKKIF